MMMQLMKDFVNYYFILFFYKPLCVAATHMFGGYFCSIMADSLAGFGGEKSIHMCGKKAFSFSFNSPWQSSRFAQSGRSRLQFSGLLRVIIPGTQSLQAS